MNMKFILSAFAAAVLSSTMLSAAGDGTSAKLVTPRSREYREILRLQENGMHSRSRLLFENLSEESAKADPEGYAILSDVIMNVPGYGYRMRRFMDESPYSVLVPQIMYRHALNLFDAQEYVKAGELLDQVAPTQIEKSQVDEYLFKKAYCELERGDVDRALLRFIELEKRPISDYTAPAKYSIAYINYEKKNFFDALGWFEKAALDGRFTQMANYYIMECRFMLKDYEYVTGYGEKMYQAVSDERKPHLARIISESWLVLGNASEARRYYELTANANGEPKTRADWFYSGSVLYAVKDYKGAIESFSNMEMRADSLGQIANYHMGYSYIQIKNKVAALVAFKDASMSSYDPAVSEDAYFNWAKLAFDINNDPSVFQDYMKRYSDREKDDKIYSYMAVAALHDKDYAGAVDAYGMIDELDDDMRNNYMKANYLRAHQLVSSGSYRMAIPCLRVAGYYSDKGSRFNQLTRYWLAESYYRNDQFQQSRELFTELYNQSALYRQPESYLIPYNIAYCYFKENDYASASRWFGEYLGEESVRYRKDALERRADCHFMRSDYKAAAQAYDMVLKSYFDADDIYPYYQAALSYGLCKNNDRKIELLSNVMDASSGARFYPEALFELGRTYALLEKDDQALECFSRLAGSVKDSTFVARAYIEMGSIARNRSQFNEALDHYKTVVEKMSLSGYADDALAAIESIYQTRNEPESYIAYIEKIGKGETKTEDEKEDMIFNSAEQIFLSENYEKALVSLQSYASRYPSGRHIGKSDFYMAESYKNLGKLEQACDVYRKVINDDDGAFVEISMLNFSNISYRLERWDDAYGGYSSLFSRAEIGNNRFAALLGMMRSAYRGHDWTKAMESAEYVIYDTRADAKVKEEAEYIKAKSCLATSRREEALEVMGKLAEDVSGPYGAEAAYLLIVDAYDRGAFSEVEEKVYAFADAGSDQMYWLAKSFIVLGDSFAERDELEQAKATFESVRDGYSSDDPADDVLDNVRMRLERIAEMSVLN